MIWLVVWRDMVAAGGEEEPGQVVVVVLFKVVVTTCITCDYPDVSQSQAEFELEL